MVTEKEATPRLFVWRGDLELTRHEDLYELSGRPIDGLPDIYAGLDRDCPFCRSSYERKRSRDDIGWETDARFCSGCGFRRTHEQWTVVADLNRSRPGNHFGQLDIGGGRSEWLRVSILKELAISDSELSLGELGTHLRRRVADVYSIEPRRFEELVADVFAQQGYSVRLTQQTRDGGYDIVLLERSGGQQAIVECKRYARTRKVGVGTVRQVLGVQLRLDVRKAKIVTTSYFSDPAMDEARQGAHVVSGYDLELVDLDRLVRELDVYNTALPPLAIHLGRDLAGEAK